MRFRFEIDASLAGMAEEEIDAAERAVTAGVREVGSLVKAGWRGIVVGAGLGQRLANTIRQNNYPRRGQSIGAASLVYARPNQKATASAADVIDAFDRGVTIRSKDALWLAIPLPAAGTKELIGRGSRRLDLNAAPVCRCASSIGAARHRFWWSIRRASTRAGAFSGAAGGGASATGS